MVTFTYKMIYYKSTNTDNAADCALTIPTLGNAKFVRVIHVPLVDCWEVLFKTTDSDNDDYRVWTKRNMPREFKTLDSAAAFLRRTGVGRFMVTQHVKSTLSQRTRT